jgi:hypothetical protein
VFDYQLNNRSLPNFWQDILMTDKIMFQVLPHLRIDFVPNMFPGFFKTNNSGIPHPVDVPRDHGTGFSE